MEYTLSNQEKAFITAYGKCMAVASDNEIEYFFQNKDKTQIGTYKEQQAIRDSIIYWSHIEDAWLLWREAIQYARSAK